MITNNTSHSNTGAGIKSDYCQDSIWSSNICTSNTSSGIGIRNNAGTGDNQNIRVAGNLCTDNAGDGIKCDDGGAGYQNLQIAIIDNICTDNTLYGVVVNNGGSGNANTHNVWGNYMSGNGSGNYSLSGSLNTYDNLLIMGGLADGAVASFSNNDTPSVLGQTAISMTAASGSRTMTALDDGVAGQIVWVHFTDANYTVDFSGTNLKGNAGVDKAMAAGDAMICHYDGTNWHCYLSLTA